MKLKEAIDRIDEMRPNTAPEEEKLRWIDSFDRMVRKEIIDAHGDAPGSPVLRLQYRIRIRHGAARSVPLRRCIPISA